MAELYHYVKIWCHTYESLPLPNKTEFKDILYFKIFYVLLIFIYFPILKYFL